MNTAEFSNEFDVLVRSYDSQSGFGIESNPYELKFDEYEKSVFLTNAQEEFIINAYEGDNKHRKSFEGSEQLRRTLNSNVKTFTTTIREFGITGLSNMSVFFKIPDDVWYITYESVDFNDGDVQCDNTGIEVFPTLQDEFHKIKNNPFRGPSKKRVLRLDIKNNIVELVSKYNIKTYLVRYLAQPKPIILTDLPDTLSINGVNTISECELNPSVHREILNRAVLKALMSKSAHQKDS